MSDLYDLLDMNSDGFIDMNELISGFMYLHNALKKPAIASYLVSIRILSSVRGTYKELIELYKTLAGEHAHGDVVHLPNQIENQSHAGTPSLPQTSPDPGTTEPTAAKPKNKQKEVAEKSTEGTKDPGKSPGEETKDPGKSPGEETKDPGKSPGSPEKSPKSKRKVPEPLEEVEEPSDQDFFGEIKAFPCDFDYLLNDSDKIDGRPYLLCFEPPERESAYLEWLLPQTLSWSRWLLFLWMMATGIMPFTEVNIVPDIVMWVRFAYRFITFLLIFAVLGYMHLKKDDWSLRLSRQAFLAIIIGFHMVLVGFFRPKRLKAMLSATGDVVDNDAWWEFLAIVYLALLGNFPSRHLIPLLLIAIAMNIFSATVLDSLILGDADKETLEGVVPFCAVNFVLLVYSFLTDRQKRFRWILENRMMLHEAPDQFFTPKASAPGSGRGHCSVLPTG